MLIRRAKKSDSKFVIGLYEKYGFKFEPNNIDSLVIAEVNGKRIALMSLSRVLECTFLTTKNGKKRDRTAALTKLVEQGIEDVKALGYDGTHAFANETIAPILKKHFGFVPGKGENLFLYIGEVI